jgi:hypothetical protein
MIERYSDARVAWSHKAEVAYTRRMARNARRAERRLEQERRAKIKRTYRASEAEKKALDLVQDVIGPEQLEVYKKTGRVFVKGVKFDWLICKNGTSVTVKQVTKDKVQDLCVHLVAEHGIPANDKVAGMILHAKFNGEYLNKRANKNGIHPRKDFEDLLQAAANF